MREMSGIGEGVWGQVCVAHPFNRFGKLALGFHEFLYGEPGFGEGDEETDRERIVMQCPDNFSETVQIAP